MSYIIMGNNQNLKMKINENIYKEFFKIRNYNQELINLNHKKNIFIKDKFINKSVPNIIRYYVTMNENTDDIEINSILNKKNFIKKSNYNDILLNEDTEINNSIALILESPHKAEFDYSNNDLIPISPAQGATGKNIENKLKELLMAIISDHQIDALQNGSYKIIIINPISFQTSLHFFHRRSLSDYHFKKLRDKVWQKFWEEDAKYKSNLSKNLKRINPSLIINACTSNLSPLVQKYLENHFKSQNIIRSYHPSAWVFNGFGLE